MWPLILLITVSVPVFCGFEKLCWPADDIYSFIPEFRLVSFLFKSFTIVFSFITLQRDDACEPNLEIS